MKKFIQRILACGSILIIAPFVLLYFLYQSPNSYHFKKEIAEENLNKSEILVFGDSHALFGVNPECFKHRTINLSNVAQPLYYDLKLIKEYIHKMKNLKIVAINLSFFSFNYNLENNPDQWRRNFYYAYWRFKPQKFDFNFFLNILTLPHFFIKKDLSVTGNIDSSGFQKNDQIKDFWLDEKNLRARLNLYKDLYDKGKSDQNITIVRDIITIAKDENIKLVFFITPKYNLYVTETDQRIINEFYTHVKEILIDQNIPFFDQSNNGSFSIDDFRDFDHLNYIGANKFSHMLSDYIELKLI